MENKGKPGKVNSNWPEHDVWYAVDRVQETYWREPLPLIQQLVASCKEQVQPTEGRDKLLAVAKEKMRLLIEARKDGPDC